MDEETIELAKYRIDKAREELEAAKDLEFEKAVSLKDEVTKLEKMAK